MPLLSHSVFFDDRAVPSESMEPTLMVHDWLIGDRHAYEEEKPQRGDIVMFYQKDENENHGQTCGSDFRGRRFLLSRKSDTSIGEPLDESAYLDDTVETDCGEEDKTFTVPGGLLFHVGG